MTSKAVSSWVVNSFLTAFIREFMSLFYSVGEALGEGEVLPDEEVDSVDSGSAIMALPFGRWMATVSNTEAFFTSGLPSKMISSSALRSVISISVWVPEKIWVMVAFLPSFNSPASVVMAFLAILVILV